MLRDRALRPAEEPREHCDTLPGQVISRNDTLVEQDFFLALQTFASVKARRIPTNGQYG